MEILRSFGEEVIQLAYENTVEAAIALMWKIWGSKNLHQEHESGSPPTLN